MDCQREHGFSLIGLIVTMGIIVVLGSILMTSVSNSLGPGVSGGVQENQAFTFADREILRRLYQSILTYENSFSALPTPTAIAKSEDKSLDTTANLFSMLIAQNLTHPQSLISKNEQSDYVWEDDDYDRSSYRPAAGQYWDPNFAADLTTLSNTSFAHVPLYGERFRQAWVLAGPSNMPVLGNRGPKDGIPSVNSYACTANGSWGGNFVYADGHVDFTNNPIGNTNFGVDNYFKIESGYDGADAILTFTKAIWENGFEMQFD